MKDKQGRRILSNLLNPTIEQELSPVGKFINKILASVTPDEIGRMQKSVDAYAKEKEELEDIKANRPLGSVISREPKSLHFSKVPDTVWKRKLRP